MEEKKKPRSHHKKKEPVIFQVDRDLQPPDWLVEDAKKEWYRVVTMLSTREVVNDLDIAEIAVYCNSYAIIKSCMRIIEEAGGYDAYIAKGASCQSVPALTTMLKTQNQLERSARLLGLTPIDRQRLNLPEKKKVSEMEKFLKGVV